MKKYLAYLMPILVILIFLMGALCSCDNRIGKLDIRNQFTEHKN